MRACVSVCSGVGVGGGVGDVTQVCGNMGCRRPYLGYLGAVTIFTWGRLPWLPSGGYHVYLGAVTLVT